MKKSIYFIMVITIVLMFSACAGERNVEQSSNKNEKEQNEIKDQEERNLPMINNSMNKRSIYLAGGCFWGVEGYFSRIKGVVDTQVGYANGETEDTNYEKIAGTKHAETVKVDYDISMISLEEILLHYFRIIDPTSVNKQGNDRGLQYRTGVYYEDEKDLESIDKVFKYEDKGK